MPIRSAVENDLGAITQIRNYYIANTNSLFEINPESVETRRTWFRCYEDKGRHRLLVFEKDQQILGYASSSKYREGEAFLKTVEASIFVAYGHHRLGVGRQLYGELFDALKNEDVHVIVAGVALPNEASVALHKKLGFESIGIFKEYAIKNGQYYSSQWFQKILK